MKIITVILWTIEHYYIEVHCSLLYQKNEEGKLTVYHSQFGHNIAEEEGGHIIVEYWGSYIMDRLLIHITGSVYQDGTAGRGGAFSNSGDIPHHSSINWQLIQ